MRGREKRKRKKSSIPQLDFSLFTLSLSPYRAVVRPEVPRRVHFERIGSRHDQKGEEESE